MNTIQRIVTPPVALATCHRCEKPMFLCKRCAEQVRKHHHRADAFVCHACCGGGCDYERDPKPITLKEAEAGRE